jgi:hypothetical protein
MGMQKAQKFFFQCTKRLGTFCLIFLAIFMLTRDQIHLQDTNDRIQPYTLNIQFNYVTWTLQALWDKFSSASMGWAVILPEDGYEPIINEYLQTQTTLDQLKQQLSDAYGNPDQDGNTAAIQQIQDQVDQQKERLDLLEPVYESLLTHQIGTILSQNQLTLQNQPVPPVLFRTTELPYALIISPRDHIEQIVNISLLPDLSLEKMVALEDTLEKHLDVSALVVPVGGIGTYPTMVMRTTNFVYTAEVIQHEWTHNYLTLRPLGINYETTPELRTINETTASITGKELGNQLLATYYPQYLPQPVEEQSADTSEQSNPQPEEQPQAAVFDYRAEMHTTRVKVDDLLLAGKIDEAESYMEARRLVFWDQGYHMRRINQAYFAFYGAYADQPGGAAGDDPVGEAVRSLRQQKGSLVSFLKTIAWVSSYDQLLSLLED